MREWYEVALDQLRSDLDSNNKVSGLEFLEDFVLANREIYFEELELEDIDPFVSEEFNLFQKWLVSEQSKYVSVEKNGKWYSSGSKQKTTSNLSDSFNLTSDETNLLKLEALDLNAGKVKEFTALYQKLASTNFHELKFKCANRLAICAESSRDIPKNQLINFWLNASDAAKDASLKKEACNCKSKAASHYARISNPEEAAKRYEEAFQIVKDEQFDNKMQLLKKARIQYQLFGDHDSASRIFCEEKKLEFNESTSSRKTALWLYRISSNYGECPKRVLWNCLIILIISTSIAYFMDITVKDKELVSDWHYIVRSAYYSVVTFTTLGYGDFTPKTHWGQLFSSIVALLGLIYSSLFMVTVVRKYSRS